MLTRIWRYILCRVRGVPAAARFPRFSLRGIRKPDWVADGEVSSAAFHDSERSAASRPDGGTEISVNWEDNDQALLFTLRQSNSGSGVARLRTEAVYEVTKLPAIGLVVFPERAREKGNPYHGNLVFVAGTARNVRRAVSAYLAAASTYVAPVPKVGPNPA